LVLRFLPRGASGRQSRPRAWEEKFPDPPVPRRRHGQASVSGARPSRAKTWVLQCSTSAGMQAMRCTVDEHREEVPPLSAAALYELPAPARLRLAPSRRGEDMVERGDPQFTVGRYSSRDFTAEITPAAFADLLCARRFLRPGRSPIAAGGQAVGVEALRANRLRLLPVRGELSFHLDDSAVAGGLPGSLTAYAASVRLRHASLFHT
jgi:hypothetical protein